MNILLTTLNSKYIHSSLGIYSVAAYLNREQPRDCNILLREYTTQMPLLNIIADMQPLAPDVVALAVYIWNREETLRLTKLIRAVLPKCTVILGGPEVSFNAAQVLSDNSEIDYIVQGEGDIVFSQLLTYLRCDGSLPDCVSGRQQLSTAIANVQDLDSLPFVYNYLPAALLDNKIVYYESSRGCPYACSYCLSGISRNVRYKSYDRVIEELRYLINQGVKQVKFVDRTYNLDQAHYLPIMQFLAEQDTETNFHFEVKADLLTKEILSFLQSVPKGRFQFEAGIQTTHAATLEAINRRDNWTKLQDNIGTLLSFGNIHVHVDLIAGLPHEDYMTFRHSFNDVHSLWADMLQLGFLKVLHGSTIETQIDEYNYKYMPFPPYEVLSNNYLDYAQLRQLKLIEDVVEKYYNSGRYKHTIKYLVTECYVSDAFAFYEQMAGYLEQCGASLQSLSSKSNLQLFLEFVKQQELLHDKVVIITELLHLDTFVAGEGWRTELFKPKLDIPDNKDIAERFWRNEELVGKYLPGYRFGSWRQVKKRYQMEQFDIDGQQIIYIVESSSGELIKIDSEDFYVPV